MRTITTQIEIAAPPAEIWSILMDFPAYGEWNPFIVDIQGSPAVGDRLRARLRPPGGRSMTFQPRVTENQEGRLFQWLGRLGVKGIFDGRHSFRIRPTDRGADFEQSEEFTGVLAGPILRVIRQRTEAGFRAMNRALKERAEARASHDR